MTNEQAPIGHVTIGNNIYFGTNVVLLKGVTIGDNCVDEFTKSLYLVRKTSEAQSCVNI